MKKRLNHLMILWICMVAQSHAQFNPQRYVQEIYPNITETTNVLFSSNVPRPNPGGGFYESITGYPLNVREYEFTNVNLFMNIFQPQGDTTSKRPVVIVCFGGGFVTGSKDHWSIRLIAQQLARRGFVTAVIDYRLGMNIFDEDLSKRAVYRGIQDGRSAVRFFRADAAGPNNYRIDPNQIYIGGHSAGAFIALHNAYLDKETERPASTYTWLQSCGFLGLSNCTCPNQGCLDCVGNNQSYSGHANALFSLAGAVGSVLYLENSNDPRAVLFHSQDDGTVPYNTGEPFSDISWLVVGSDLPIVYGSLPISNRSASINLPYQFFSYTDRGHGVHEQTSTTLYSDILPGIANWFYNQRLKPTNAVADGNIAVCKSQNTQTYKVSGSNAKYYHWTVTGGNIAAHPVTATEVQVVWDTLAPQHSITVRPYSQHWAAGNPVTLNIQLQNTATNTWTGGTGNWNVRSNWSLQSVPQSCHHVIIPSGSNMAEPVIPTNIQSTIRSITLQNGRNLMIQTGSQLIIKEE